MIRLRTNGTRAREALPAFLLALILAALAPAGAQEPPRAQLEPPAAAPAPPLQPGPTGPFGTIGRFIDESLQGLGQGLKGAREQVDDLTGRAGSAAKDAARSLPLRRPSIASSKAASSATTFIR